MNICKTLPIVALVATLSGCAGLGELCGMANGYTVITPDGKSATIIPAKCAILSGKGLNHE